MAGELENLTLQNIASGVAGELFGRELEKVLENIADPNTAPKAKRKITLTFEFTPSDGRDASTVVVQSTAKLSSVKPAAAMVFIGTRNGKSQAYAHNPAQIVFDMETEAQKPTVVPMKGPNQ